MMSPRLDIVAGKAPAGDCDVGRTCISIHTYVHTHMHVTVMCMQLYKQTFIYVNMHTTHIRDADKST